MSALRWLAALVLLFGCDSGAPAVKREPLTLMVGEAGDSLGTRLATCADGTVVGAAPGRPGVWVVDAGVVPLPRDAGTWTEVGCVTSSGGQHWLAAAGSAGVVARQPASPTWQVLQPGDFLSLAGGPRGAPLLAGERSGAVRWFDADTTASISMMMLGEDEVDALAWFPAGDGLLVGSSSVSGVDDWRLDGGAATLKATLFMHDGFGRAVLVGDVSPRPGLELIISTRGAVWIVDATTGTTITVLRGASGDFGAALALSASGYAGLEALWVSDPTSGKVHFFIGDAGIDATPNVTATTGALGASLAFANDVLYVGAPQTPPGGAIVAVGVSISPVTNFELRECGPTSCVKAGCAGVCVGGVVCDFSACARVDAGSDAGSDDAGSDDAGSGDGSDDAGSDDAGSDDAGSVDAGASHFSTTGCASVNGAQLLLLVALLRPRRAT